MIDDVVARLQKHAVLPAVIIDDAEQAEPLAEAMLEGGLPIAEVTLRTPAALSSLKRMAGHEKMLVGAGTVMNASKRNKLSLQGRSSLYRPA